jgi:hypothetical protein
VPWDKEKRQQPKTINEDKEIESPNALIQAEAPNRGFAPPLDYVNKYHAFLVHWLGEIFWEDRL